MKENQLLVLQTLLSLLELFYWWVLFVSHQRRAAIARRKKNTLVRKKHFMFSMYVGDNALFFEPWEKLCWTLSQGNQANFSLLLFPIKLWLEQMPQRWFSKHSRVVATWFLQAYLTLELTVLTTDLQFIWFMFFFSKIKLSVSYKVFMKRKLRYQFKKRTLLSRQSTCQQILKWLYEEMTCIKPIILLRAMQFSQLND